MYDPLGYCADDIFRLVGLVHQDPAEDHIREELSRIDTHWAGTV